MISNRIGEEENVISIVQAKLNKVNHQIKHLHGEFIINFGFAFKPSQAPFEFVYTNGKKEINVEKRRRIRNECISTPGIFNALNELGDLLRDKVDPSNISIFPMYSRFCNQSETETTEHTHSDARRSCISDTELKRDVLTDGQGFGTKASTVKLLGFSSAEFENKLIDLCRFSAKKKLLKNILCRVIPDAEGCLVVEFYAKKNTGFKQLCPIIYDALRENNVLAFKPEGHCSNKNMFFYGFNKRGCKQIIDAHKKVTIENDTKKSMRAIGKKPS